MLRTPIGLAFLLLVSNAVAFRLTLTPAEVALGQPSSTVLSRARGVLQEHGVVVLSCADGRGVIGRTGPGSADPGEHRYAYGHDHDQEFTYEYGGAESRWSSPDARPAPARAPHQVHPQEHGPGTDAWDGAQLADREAEFERARQLLEHDELRQGSRRAPPAAHRSRAGGGIDGAQREVLL